MASLFDYKKKEYGKDKIYFIVPGYSVKDYEFVYKEKISKGKKYYVNLATKERKWILPEITFIKVDGIPFRKVVKDQKVFWYADGRKEREFGFREKEKNGKQFFVNLSSKKSMWKLKLTEEQKNLLHSEKEVVQSEKDLMTQSDKDISDLSNNNREVLPQNEKGETVQSNSITLSNGTQYNKIVKKGVSYFILAGHSISELDFVYKEKEHPTKGKYFRNLGKKKSHWKLPEVSLEKEEDKKVTRVEEKAVEQENTKNDTKEETGKPEILGKVSNESHLQFTSEEGNVVSNSPQTTSDKTTSQQPSVKDNSIPQSNNKEIIESKSRKVLREEVHEGTVYEVYEAKGCEYYLVKGHQFKETQYLYKKKNDPKRNKPYYRNIKEKKSYWKLPKHEGDIPTRKNEVDILPNSSQEQQPKSVSNDKIVDDNIIGKSVQKENETGGNATVESEEPLNSDNSLTKPALEIKTQSDINTSTQEPSKEKAIPNSAAFQSPQVKATTPTRFEIFTTRGVLEDHVEQALFYRIGLGETRVMIAITGKEYVSLQNKDHKVDCLFVIARDFSGCYGLFIVKKKGTKYPGFYRGIPITSPFTSKTIEHENGNVKFMITMNKESIVIVTADKLKERLIRGLNFAIGHSLAIQTVDNVLRMKYVIGTCNFIHELTNSICSGEEENLSSDYLVTSLIRKQNTSLELQLRILMTNPVERDIGLKCLIEFMNSPSFGKSNISACFDILTLYEMVVTQTNLDLSHLIRILSDLLQNLTYEKKFHLSKRLETWNLIASATKQWKTRGDFNDVPFPPEFYGDGTTKQAKKIIKERQQLRTTIAKNVIDAGVVISVAYFSPSQVVTQNGNLPYFVLEGVTYEDVVNMDPSNPEFAFLLSLNYDQRLVLGESLKYQPTFIRKFLSCYLSIRQSEDWLPPKLFLYDRVVKQSKTLMFVFYCEVRMIPTATLPQQLSIENVFEFEHKTYQKYNHIEFTARLDRLDSSYFGLRWLNNISRTIDSQVSRQGLYVGLLHYRYTHHGLEILVENDCRGMIPFQYIGDSSVRIDQNYLKNWTIANINNGSKLQSNSFTKKFTEAFVKLKDRLESSKSECILENVRILPDPVEISENDSVKVLVCVSESTDFESKVFGKDKFLWRSLKVFEIMHHRIFNPNSFEKFIQRITSTELRKPVWSDSDKTTDEIMRFKKYEKEFDLWRQFFSMRWYYHTICAVKYSDPKEMKGFSERTKHQRIDPFIMKEHCQLEKQIITESQEPFWIEISEKLTNVEKDDLERKNNIAPVSPVSEEDDEEVDWENIQATIADYNIEYEDLAHFEKLVVEPQPREICLSITNDLIEDTISRHLYTSMIKDVSQCLEDMLDILDVKETLTEQVEDLFSIEETAKQIVADRNQWKKNFINYAQLLINRSNVGNVTSLLSILPHQKKRKLSYDHLIQDHERKFSQTVGKAETLLQSICSVQEAYDLIDGLQSLENLFKSENKLKTKIMNSKEFDTMKVFHEMELHQEMANQMDAFTELETSPYDSSISVGSRGIPKVTQQAFDLKKKRLQHVRRRNRRNQNLLKQKSPRFFRRESLESRAFDTISVISNFSGLNAFELHD